MSADPAAAREPETPLPDRPARFPGLGDLRAALGALTIFRPAGMERTVDSSTLLYPVVGLFLGVTWLATDRLSSLAAGRLVASLAVLLIANALAAGRPLLGLGRLLAAVLSTGSREVALDRLAGRLTLMTWIMVTIVVAGELALLSALQSSRGLGLVFAPLLGRWSMVVLAVGSREARADGRRLKFAPEVTFREFGWASTITFAIVLGVSEFLGVLLAVGAAIASVGARVGLHRWLDGVSITTLDASCEAVQLLTIGLLVALQ